MKKQPLAKSFRHAFEGIWAVIKKERNIKIHLTVMGLVIAAGFITKISALEWCVCITLFGLVISLEMVNTAIEAVVDLASPKWHALAKLAKDAAAGAVLVAAIAAAAAGLIIFVPKAAVLFGLH